MKSVAQSTWGAHCGVVMQEGYIFNNAIAKNIAVDEDRVHKQKLQKTVDIVCVRDVIKEEHAVEYDTNIGN
ncbi:MAG: hypothetical protein ABI045_06310 [Flavobacteriales bacterium]